jgi:hypothetical protein
MASKTKTPSKKNARQILAVTKKIEKTSEFLKGLQEKLTTLQQQEAAEAKVPTESKAESKEPADGKQPA